MRVLLDATYARRAPHSGTAIYIDRVCAELARDGQVDVVRAVNQRRRAPGGGGAGSLRNLGSDLWWTAVELPRRARQVGAQLIHHPLPARAPVSPVAQVVTVADLAFERLPADFDRRFRTYAHLTHRAAALAAGAVISISETTAADARDLWGVPPERLVIAHHGPGQELPARRRSERPAHFLYVGDAEPRKDVPTLLEAYRRYREMTAQPLDLVLAGSARAYGPGIQVELGPPPARLADLYASAVALVHPSRYEGFGLTPLEAMRLGTPVLAARSPGVTEVCAEAARYVAPSDAPGLARAMAQLAEDPALRRELSVRGTRRAAKFSWSECARRHVEAYSLALSGTHE